MTVGRALALTIIGSVVIGMVIVHASDSTAMYVLVDQVVMEPNDERPERIRIWGVFAMPKPNDRNDYLPPQFGHVYFRLPDSGADLARREWSDLRRSAGQRIVIGLGSRHTLKARVRTTAETTPPDVYVLANGLFRLRSDTDYAPIRALLEFRPR